MKHQPTLGTWTDGGKATLDVARLIETRMLIQANSGGGKSWALRRLLEQTAGEVQQLVIDPEGEFSTLRERHDLVIAAAHDGDALAHPKTAKLLAERLLETGVSAVLDIYDLKAHERMAFVRIFLDALVNAPKSLWRPALVVLDEAHVYAPEDSQAESAGAVIDLATRGRKRGFCLVAATQRIAKFNKDAAAELLNKMIGRTGLDVDVKRAAFELGISPKDAMTQLRPLSPGHFYAFGPAINPEAPAVLDIGAVETTHPKVGDRQLRVPPKPTAAIKAVLPKLADLPKEAEQQARTVDELKREIAGLRRELRAKPAPAGVSQDQVKAIEARAISQATKQANDAARREAEHQRRALRSSLHVAIDQVLKQPPAQQGVPPARVAPLKLKKSDVIHLEQRQFSREELVAVDESAIAGLGKRILDALAWLEDKNIAPAAREAVGAVAGVKANGGYYTNKIGALRTAGLITYPQPGTIELTPQGREVADAGDPSGEIHEKWLKILRGLDRQIVATLIERHPLALSRADLGDILGKESEGGYFTNTLGRLRTLGAIDYPQPGHVALTKHVMP